VKAVELGDDLRRTASRIDRDYKVSDKVKEFTSTVQEKADEVDQKFSVRRKAVTAWEDFQRNWPVVSVFHTSFCLPSFLSLLLALVLF
jgi:hypothetical protein